MKSLDGVYRYCQYARVAEAEAVGWQNLGPLPGNHGNYAVLMFWPHEGEGPWFAEGHGMTAPRVEHLSDDVSVWLGDCEEILPMLGKFDAAVFDPPYGIKESAGKAKTRTSGLTSKLRNAQRYRRDYGDDNWDEEPLGAQLLAQIMNCAKWKIIFGGNYYCLPPTSCWLVWDKLNGDTDFADCELAWTNLPIAVRRIRYLWNGCMRMERHIPREHPTQKPLGVMEWCLTHLPDGTGSIIDPTMGVGTTGVAAILGGFSFVGIERLPKYFDAACVRLADAIRSPRLPLGEPEPRPKQQAFL